MRALIQRVSQATVCIGDKETARIGKGFLVLLGIGDDDGAEDTDWLSEKILRMRIFSDAQGLMNLSLAEVGGKILLVSQFTLHASTKKGNRPSFIRAARPEQAIPLYEAMKEKLRAGLGSPVCSGTFGADMQIALVNDGPVTIWIDSKNRE